MFKKILSPLKEQIPFMVFFMVLMGEPMVRKTIDQLQDSYIPGIWLDVAGQFSIIFLVGYLFAILMTKVPKTWLKCAIYFIVLTLFAITLYLENNFGMSISPQALVLLSETNTREASEFLRMFTLNPRSLITYAILAIVIAAIIFTERYWKKHCSNKTTNSKKSNKDMALALPTLLLLAFGLFSCGSFIRMFKCDTTDKFYRQQDDDIIKPFDPFSRCVQSVYGLHLASNEMKTAVEVTRNIKPSSSKLSSDSLDVILIIGESFSKWHSQLYGYKAETSPLLSQEVDKGQLFVFNDVVSPFSLTSVAMKNCLCCNSFVDDEPWNNSPYMPAVFKSAGYGVYLWDNQKDISPNQGFSFALNTFLYNKDMVNMSYTAINKTCYPYDFSLIDDFGKADWRKQQKNLSIIHLLGQHFKAGERYPHVPLFSRFNADSIHFDAPYLNNEKKQEIADYDNATLYNDYVVKSVIDLFRERNAIIVYFSDHGEEVYDYKDAIGRHYEGLDNDWLKYIHEIPFVVWCSEKYIATHTSTMEEIAKAKDRPFTTDNICHMLFHVGELSTPYYIAERDVLSDKYRERKRIVLGKEDFKKADFDKVRVKNP